ncbi:MAG: hypothetical protein JO250_04875 [Armatimonadetes bacterium]|nr:hypothetical protein [Armatimonadota bacterium]
MEDARARGADEDSPAGTPPKPEGVTLRALAVAVALSVGSALWVRQAEIVVLATQVSESVPPIPALAVLILLVGLNPALRALGPRFGLSQGEQVTVYSFVAIAVSICGPGCVRFVLSLLTAPYHDATPQNGFNSLWHLIPPWLAVSDPQAIQEYYQGGRHGTPWRLWLAPLLTWGTFLMALWTALLCLVLLVRRRWIETERLAFPQVQLLLEMTGGDAGGRAFLRNPIMWAGFGLAALYNGVNILHALVPWVPAIGTTLDLTPALSAYPWKGIGAVTLMYRPDLIGFGFLVPTEICFSIWFFFLLSRAESFFAFTHAWGVAGVPFEQEQSMGAFLVLGLWSLWQVRGDARRMPGPLLGLAASLLFLIWFCARAGMDLWVAAAYLGIVLVTALASARVRADSGVPLIWLFPFYQQKKVLLNLLGTAPFVTGGMPGTMTIFALLTFLARGYFPALIGYQVDGFKMAEAVRLPRRQMAGVIVLAALVGIALAFWIHLTTYYRYGAENIGGGLWGSWVAVPEFEAVRAVQPPDPVRTAATGFGGVLTVLLLLARQAFVHFPLHPLGYAVATAYGTLVWWPFLVVWVFKAGILRWGGVRLYRRAIPLFLGFALGHFFVAGVVWGLIGAFWPDAARAYGVWFG